MISKPQEIDCPKCHGNGTLEESRAPSTTYFVYRQNNSFGVFRGPAIFVFVEALTPDDADQKAKSIGLYFDGAGDCPCCGHRWNTAWHSLTTQEPIEYLKPALSRRGMQYLLAETECPVAVFLPLGASTPTELTI